MKVKIQYQFSAKQIISR